MVALPITGFKGLDVRRLRESSDPRTARVAKNLSLSIGGEFESGPRPRLVMGLDPQSVGLYSIGGTLRAVVPGKQNIPLNEVGPVRVKYDAIATADDTAYPVDVITRVVGVETVGSSASFGVYPYLAIERQRSAADPSQGTFVEHHWIRSEPPDGTTSVKTKVALPFAPGPSLVQASGKVWAPDDVNGVVRFCSTLEGPANWTAEEDAGYIPVLTHASGDRRIQALGIYDDKLAVIFPDAVQLWATDPQPTNITLVRVVDGPGTEKQRSVVNVLGDLFYLTSGGFRSLHTATVTGQIQQQDDIGSPIDDLVKGLAADANAAIWSQLRGQYLCAIGSVIYAFRYSPTSKLMGWTTWDMGVEVEYLVEQGGVTWFRSGDNLYKLDDAYDDNAGWELVLNDVRGRSAINRKRLDFIELIQRGTSTLRVFTEPETDEFYTDGPTVTGSTVPMNPIFVGAMARTFGLRFTGHGPWRLSAVNLTYKDLA